MRSSPQKVWRKIQENVDEYDIFGFAVDGGTDRVLGEGYTCCTVFL